MDLLLDASQGIVNAAEKTVARTIVNLGSQDSSISKKFEEWYKAMPSNSDTELLKKVFTILEKSPKVISILANIHGGFIVKKLAQDVIIRVERRRVRNFKAKQKAEKDEKDLEEIVKRSVEDAMNRSLVGRIGNETEILSPGVNDILDDILVTDPGSEFSGVIEILKNNNIYFWLGLDPEKLIKIPENGNKKDVDFSKIKDILINIKSKLVTHSASSESIESFISNLIHINIEDERLRVLYISILRRLTKGESLESILNELVSVINLLTQYLTPDDAHQALGFNEANLIKLLNDYREIWLAGNAYDISSFNFDLARSSSMSEELREKFGKVDPRFSDYDPVMALGFVTMPDVEKIDQLKTSIERLPEAIEGNNLNSFVKSLNSMNSRERRYFGRLFNEIDEDEIGYISTLSRNVEDLINKMVADVGTVPGIDMATVTIIRQAIYDFLTTSGSGVDFEKISNDFTINLDLIRDIYADSDDNTKRNVEDMLEVLKELPSFRQLYSDRFPDFYESGGVAGEENISLLNLFKICGSFDSEGIFWNQLSLASMGDLSTFIGFSIPTPEEIKSNYETNRSVKLGIAASLRSVLEGGHVGALREAFISHLIDIKNGDIADLGNIRDKDHRDHQKVILGIYNQVTTLGDEFPDISLEDLNINSIVDKGLYFTNSTVPTILTIEDIRSGYFVNFITTSKSILLKAYQLREFLASQPVGSDPAELSRRLAILEDIISRYYALGFSYNPESSIIDFNEKVLKMYLNGIRTYIPGTEYRQLGDNYVVLDENSRYNCSKVYSGKRINL